MNYTYIKAVAVALFAFVATCTPRAHAGEDVRGDVFTTGVGFEFYGLGDLNPRLTDEATEDGYFHWYAAKTNDIGQVQNYTAGNSAYDYAAHGQTRRAFFATHESSYQTNHFKVNSEQGLDRAIFSRTAPLDTNFSNVLIRTENRDSIYCDMLVKFTAGASTPESDDTTRIAVWARTLETDDGDIVTNLMVTAGYSADGFRTVVWRDYRLDFDVDLSRWYRLVVRAHGDVSSQDIGIAGFSIYIDGAPVCGVADEYALYDASKVRAGWLNAEARTLLADRRLFLGLSAPGSDDAFTLSGCNFTGNGLLDDLAFSSADPGYAAPETVFTLLWDAGVTTLKYTLDGGATTTAVDVTASPRSLDIPIGAEPEAGLTLTVVEVAYDTAREYRAGTWSASNGAVLEDGTNFVYEGESKNPIAAVASTIDAVNIGGDAGYASFAEALAALDGSTNETKRMTLMADFTPSYKWDAARKYNDKGCVTVANKDGEYILDLNGYTLRGANPREATLTVKCKSFRIVDSSAGKTGKILPVGDYLSESSVSNSAVVVYPNKDTEPILAIEAGTYDGWVRNDGQPHLDTIRRGVVYVEGGSFISTNSETFYLQGGVTNETSFFTYRSGYWTCLSADVFVWTGLGDGKSWVDPENWKCHAVPTSTDTALFPSRAAAEGPWPVYVGVDQMTTKTLWLEGDIAISGTNDFVGVTLTGGGKGRVAGTGTLVWDGSVHAGEIPGKLSETVLATNWAGTVLLKNIQTGAGKSPKVLKSMDTWGTRYSTVEFNGVKGYVMDAASHSMPYKFVLRDAGNYPAWQNDSGYRGTTLAFMNALLGDGTLQIGENSRAIYQLIKFADPSEFTGKFIVKGKRVLLGTDSVSISSAGVIAFADHAVVRTGLGWTCYQAVFGESLELIGETNQVLVTATKAEPDVTCCTNTTLNGLANIAWLATTNQPQWSVYVTGERPSYVPASANALAAAPSLAFASAASASSSSYSAAALAASARVLKAYVYDYVSETIDQAQVSLEISDESVSVVVSNATEGLWYGLRHRSSLAAEWEAPTHWVKATGSTVTMTCDKTEDAGFYGVVVSIDDPTGGGTGD